MAAEETGLFTILARFHLADMRAVAVLVAGTYGATHRTEEFVVSTEGHEPHHSGPITTMPCVDCGGAGGTCVLCLGSGRIPTLGALRAALEIKREIVLSLARTVDYYDEAVALAADQPGLVKAVRLHDPLPTAALVAPDMPEVQRHFEEGAYDRLPDEIATMALVKQLCRARDELADRRGDVEHIERCVAHVQAAQTAQKAAAAAAAARPTAPVAAAPRKPVCACCGKAGRIQDTATGLWWCKRTAHELGLIGPPPLPPCTWCGAPGLRPHEGAVYCATCATEAELPAA